MQSSSHGVPIGLAQLQSTMQAIEFACSSIQINVNPAEAEATILSLRQSPHAYQICKYILEKSQVGNARFQAAAALRDVAIKEWGFLTSVDKGGLISFCLCFLFQYSSLAEGYVLTKVSSVAAQLLKRGWLDFTAAEKDTFLSEVKQAVLGTHGVVAQFIGMSFLESMVVEFLPSTSTSMGLPREFHEQCRDLLELDYLKKIYCWAQDAAVNVTGRIVDSGSDVAEDKLCAAALNLMFQILNWDFQFNKGAGEGANNRTNVFTSDVRNDAVPFKKSERIQPGSAWRDVLLSSGHIGWILGLYGTLRQKFSNDGYWLDSPLAETARKLIVHFCSLSGTIFPSDNGQMQEQHLLQILSGIIQWVDPPDAISEAIECGKTASEMLDGCRALLSIASLTTPIVFDKLLKSISPFGTLSLLSALTREVLKAHVASNTDEETWSWVARDILLDTWTALLEPIDTNRDDALPPEGIAAAATVFELIVEAELTVASRSAFDDDDDCDYLRASISAMDERLSSYALIARAAVDITVPLLTRLFSVRIALLHQGRGTSDPTCTLEELYSLLLITGHVLADAGEGETPLVPEALRTPFVGRDEQHPVIALSSSIISFAEQSLNPDMRASFFSPRLMEAVIWFLARWSDTYVMPLESGNERQHMPQPSSIAVLNFCGEHDRGKSVLNVIVRISLISLISYPGENNLQELTCHQLLPALVRRKNVCLHLVTLDSWCNLANAFANERSFFSLTSPFQRSIADTLVRSATGMTTLEASNQFVTDLTRQITAYLVDLSSKNDLKTVAQQPDAVLWVSSLLERLRGAARATQPQTRKALYEMGVSVMSSILVLLGIYKYEPAVVYVILKFVVDWVDGQIVFLEAKETAVVVKFCLQLLQLYSVHNIGKISLSCSSSLLSEANTEKYKDLRALIQLLTKLCSKDLVDFSSDSNEAETTDIAQVIYLGLHIVTPLISLELLKYPKLCNDYFALLAHILGVHPEKVAQLNAEMLAHLVGTLDYGIHNQDIEVVNMCLGALNALASYHYKERVAGREGFGSDASAIKDMNGRPQDNMLSRFLQSLLQLLLFEDYSSELVSSAADALLPLILCEQGLYQRLGHELIEGQATPELKSRLANALQALTSSNQLSSSLNRINYQKFRKNLYNFLIEVRGFLRKK
ncbi:hypothetical protein AQUCO_03400340v1 [Aquilegia coerulea]|uniref:Exportin-4 n=1 Tax=Aquilegia coerulea TaxID=218851 RepID=A0A2G5CYN8_AQUCA|nr:hypothetical protein AQUCO_03400340v1 [Aquilegia coerulea]PIA36378.1 hypothetical protein AQUCO_03400340v1 [Aquilegia coerulea]